MTGINLYAYVNNDSLNRLIRPVYATTRGVVVKQERNRPRVLPCSPRDFKEHAVLLLGVGSRVRRSRQEGVGRSLRCALSIANRPPRTTNFCTRPRHSLRSRLLELQKMPWSEAGARSQQRAQQRLGV
jgi:hypothetical protein